MAPSQCQADPLMTPLIGRFGIRLLLRTHGCTTTMAARRLLIITVAQRLHLASTGQVRPLAWRRALSPCSGNLPD